MYQTSSGGGKGALLYFSNTTQKAGRPLLLLGTVYAELEARNVTEEDDDGKRWLVHGAAMLLHQDSSTHPATTPPRCRDIVEYTVSAITPFFMVTPSIVTQFSVRHCGPRSGLRGLFPPAPARSETPKKHRGLENGNGSQYSTVVESSRRTTGWYQ